MRFTDLSAIFDNGFGSGSRALHKGEHVIRIIYYLSVSDNRRSAPVNIVLWKKFFERYPVSFGELCGRAVDADGSAGYDLSAVLRDIFFEIIDGCVSGTDYSDLQFDCSSLI